MPRKTKKKEPEYTCLSIKVEDFNVSVHAGINHEIIDTRNALPNDPIYKFYSHIEISGTSTYPEERVNCRYDITLTNYVGYSTKFDSLLKDYHLRDEEFCLKYRTVKGQEFPIYDQPKSIGYIEKRRGLDSWMCYASVSGQTITDMVILLSNVKPLFLEIHEVKISSKRHVRSITLQTNDPSLE